jgi:hypothetical protein
MPQSSNLLILGCGACLWDDLARYDSIHADQDRMGVNDAIIHYTGVLQHGASLHDDCLEWLANYRQKFIKPTSPDPMIAHYWPYPTTQFNYQPSRAWEFVDFPPGSSSYYAVLVGLGLGYERIILAGVPMDKSAHFYCPNYPYDYWTPYGPAWQRAAETIFEGRVKSLSGNTRELLGEP